MILWLKLALATVVAWGVARWLTRVAGEWGLRRGIVSHVTERSSHTRPTSRLGGVGLAGGYGAGMLVWLIFFPYERGIASGVLAAAILGWMMLFVVGLLDDLRDLPPLAKLAGLALGCALPVAVAYLEQLNLADGNISGSYNVTLPGTMVYLFALGWMLFFVNAYNFMDGMDGFAGNFARAAGLSLLLVILQRALFHGPVLGAPLILAGAATGFLKWNAPPAKYFMGDGGSLSTGFVLGLLLLGCAMGGGLLPAFIVLLPFSFDVSLTLIRRARRGENLLRAHRSHLYQRLMQTGLTHAQVLRINVYNFIGCGVLGVVAAATDSFSYQLFCLVLALALMGAYWLHTLRREARQRAAH